MERREVSTRNTSWAKKMAAICAARGITPNVISVSSMAFALISFLCFYFSTHENQAIRNSLLIISILSIQGRLLCNLFDGMVAVEYNKSSVIGEIYNDAPDRVSDILIILGAGLSINQNFSNEFFIHILWITISLAILTAYIRVLGSSMGAKGFFNGPMAKQHRMFTITLGTILTLVNENFFNLNYSVIKISIYIILVGSIITILNRLQKIVECIYRNNN